MRHEFIGGYSQTAITMGLSMVMAIKKPPEGGLRGVSIVHPLSTQSPPLAASYPIFLDMISIACNKASLV